MYFRSLKFLAIALAANFIEYALVLALNSLPTNTDYGFRL